MKKNIFLWLTVCFLAFLTLPGIVNRHHVETNQNNYETIMPFSEIIELSEHLDIPIEDLLIELKQAGLEVVSLESQNLSMLENRRILKTFTRDQLEERLIFQPQLMQKLPTETDDITQLYTTIPEDPYYQLMIEKTFSPDRINFESVELYLISAEDDPVYLDGEPYEIDIYDRYLGYNTNNIDLIQKTGLHYILRVENLYPDYDCIINDLLSLKNDHFNGILFSGEELIGYPSQDLMKTYSQSLTDAGFHFYSIEFTNQRGLNTFADASNYNFIRLHSITLDDSQLDVSIERSVRAVKERNIRSLFIRLPRKSDPNAQLTDTLTYLETLPNSMPSYLTRNIPAPFEIIGENVLSTIAAILGSVVLAFVTLTFISNKWIKYIGSGLLLIIGSALFILEMPILNQAFALLIALIGATYSTLIATKGSTELKGILLAYLKAIGITTLTALFLIQILNSNAYILGFRQFRGVSLVYTLPIVSIGIWAFRDVWIYAYKTFKATKWETLRRLGKRFTELNVKYWHIILFVLLAVGFNYYLSRGGNAGSVTDLELWFRSQLEAILFVRPRTKEFLIGLPVFVFSIYLTGRYPKIGRFFFIVGSIGFLSIINTFSHLHTPLYVSLLRSVYSLILGFIIGLILIKIYQLVETRVKKLWR